MNDMTDRRAAELREQMNKPPLPRHRQAFLQAPAVIDHWKAKADAQHADISRLKKRLAAGVPRYRHCPCGTVVMGAKDYPCAACGQTEGKTVDVALLLNDRDKLMADIARLGFESLEHMGHPSFGLMVNRDETLREAIERWYAEFDQVRKDQAADIARLRELLPDATKLRVLANWFDTYDDEALRYGQDEVQRDLRQWADNADAALRGDAEPATDAVEILKRRYKPSELSLENARRELAEDEAEPEGEGE